MRVLTTNPGYRNTLALIRALATEGVQVEVVGFQTRAGKDTDGPVFHSKYCKGRHFVRDPRREPAAFVDDLAALLAREKFDAILPVGTNAVVPMSKAADRLRPLAPFPFPDYDKVELAHNKLSMIRLAETANVGVPHTVTLDSLDTVDERCQGYDFPAIVKTRKGGGSNGVFVVRSVDDVRRVLADLQAEAAEAVDDVCNDTSDPMLQEMIPGQIFDVPFLAQNGKVVAHIVQYRERMLPVNGGSGMINKTCDHDRVREEAFRLVEAIGWDGIGLVEFKLDADGNPRLMELNPKFWGTLDLSIQAGVNFPYLAFLHATGQPIPKTEYRRGARYRWMVPDGIRTVRASDDRWKAAFEFFFPWRPDTTSEVWIRDLAPTAFSLKRELKSWKAARVRRKNERKAAAH